MDIDRVLSDLEAAGTETNRSVFRRHGVTGPVFGVSFAHQATLARRIGVDHDLAGALWATGNHDARVLATMIADPDALTSHLVDDWKADLDNHVIADAFAALVSRAPGAVTRAGQWTRSQDDWVARAGWSLVARLARSDPTLEDAFFAGCIEVIEAGAEAAGDRTRDAMNSALIAIGMRNGRLRDRAIQATRRPAKGRRGGNAATP